MAAIDKMERAPQRDEPERRPERDRPESQPHRRRKRTQLARDDALGWRNQRVKGV